MYSVCQPVKKYHLLYSSLYAVHFLKYVIVIYIIIWSFHLANVHGNYCLGTGADGRILLKQTLQKQAASIQKEKILYLECEPGLDPCSKGCVD
jgi:hypothetical protein